jgi:hypothetical protein
MNAIRFPPASPSRNVGGASRGFADRSHCVRYSGHLGLKTTQS